MSDLRRLCAELLQIDNNLNDAKSHFKPIGILEHIPPPWCCCGNCKVMPKVEENICCENPNCITKSDAYLHLLAEHVVYSAISHKEEIRKILKRKNYHYGNLPNFKKKVWSVSFIRVGERRKLYQKYTAWAHGRLGIYNRKPIPSCVVWSVRATYPSPDGKYAGFCRVDEN